METEARMNLKPGLIGSGIIISIMIILSVWAWTVIPAGKLLPVHGGLNGPDCYGSKAEALLGLPVTALFMTGLFLLIAKIEPRKRNLQLSSKAYTTMWLASLSFFLVMHVFGILRDIGMKLSVNSIIYIIGPVFIVIGNYMGKIRSNYFFGIRTPWTLSSEFAWDKTHRFGGKIYILLGIIILASALSQNLVLPFTLMMSEILVSALMVTIYSYFAWKMDPGRADNSQIQPGSSTLKGVAVFTVVLMFLLAVGVVYRLRPNSASQALVTRAREVVQLQANGDFAGAEKNFDQTMKDALPPEKLKDLWQKFGKFTDIEGTRTENLFIFQIVYVTTEFESQTVDFKIVFNTRGQVSGLWIVPSAASKPNSASQVLVTRAREVVQLQSKGDFAGAEKNFDQTMKDALSPERLRNIWQGIGKYKDIEGTRTERLVDYQIVYITTKFDSQTVDFKIVFNTQGQVSGLWIVPPGERH